MTPASTIIKPISYDELVWYGKTPVINIHVYFASFFLVEERAYANALRLTLLHHLHKIGQGKAGVNDIFYQQYVFVFDAAVQIFYDTNNTARFRRISIGRNSHEIQSYVDVGGNCPHQVGKENYSSLEDTYDYQFFPGVIASNLFSYLSDAYS